jgi:hypothetical protein
VAAGGAGAVPEGAGEDGAAWVAVEPALGAGTVAV